MSGDPATKSIPEPAPSGAVESPALLTRQRQLGDALEFALANKGLLSLVDQGIVSGTSFVTGVLIGRMCLKEQLGLYYLALSIIMFVRGIQDHLISIPYMVCWSRRPREDQAAFTGSALVFQCMFSAATVLGLLGAGVFLSRGAGPEGADLAVWVLLGTIPFFLLRELLRQFGFASFHLLAVICFDLGISLLQVGGMAFLGYQGRLSASTAYGAMAAACAAGMGVWFWSRHQPIQFVRTQLGADWRDTWFLARWTLPGALISSATPQITPWLLATWHGTSATGVLAACATLAGFAQVFLTGVGNILTPRAARAYATGGSRELARILGKALVVFCGGIGSFCLLFLFAGDLLLVKVFGEQYAGNGQIVSVSVFSVLVNSFGNVAGNGLWAVKQPQANFYADVGTLLVTLGTAGVLVPPLGPMGAALAILSGATAAALIRGFTLMRILSGLSSELGTSESVREEDNDS